MLKIIEPHVHEFYGEKIDTLLGLLKIYQNFYLFPDDRDKATFVVAEDDKRGIYGGAVLYPCMTFPSLEFMPEDTHDEILGKIFSSFHPKTQEYWTARICLCIGHDTSTPLFEAVKLCQHFYRTLYKAFCYFGEQKRIEYLTFTLRPTDTHVGNTLRMLTYQTWPYLIEVRASENSDRLFHGILSLKENPFKARRQSRKFLNLRTSSKANVLTENSSPLEEWSA